MVKSKGTKSVLTDVIIIVIVGMVSILCIAPLLNTLAISFSAQSRAEAGQVLFWPVSFTLASYANLIGDEGFSRAFLVSLERVILGGGLNLILTIMMAYPLSKGKKVFRARNIYMWLIVSTMLFSGGLIPWYMTIRALGLLDTIWALVLPGAVPVFNVILLMNFFRGVPKEVEEAAFMDGAGPWCIMLKIIVPISKPAIATVTLFSIVGQWNSFFDGLVLMNKAKNYPLQTYIQQLVLNNDMSSIVDYQRLQEMMVISNKTFNAAKIFVSMVPLLIIYPFLQKYFVTGITLGSVKE